MTSESEMQMYCPCGATTIITRGGGTLPALRAVGWGGVMDISDGLTILPLCPPCLSRVQAAAEEIRAVVKKDPSHITLSAVLRD